ncbi:unnamed protein product [Allacma fusca]|uniref:Uncharacterized protein n=1 Tax=Allacma fusca TaxID=39272 RepID=A0A8J2L0A3_9HEXA|nr:unnamed protein product [Allacma fusca]
MMSPWSVPTVLVVFRNSVRMVSFEGNTVLISRVSHVKILYLWRYAHSTIYTGWILPTFHADLIHPGVPHHPNMQTVLWTFVLNV